MSDPKRTGARAEAASPCDERYQTERDLRERKDKLRELKERVRKGTYQADLKDIAEQLTTALDPKL